MLEYICVKPLPLGAFWLEHSLDAAIPFILLVLHVVHPHAPVA